MHILTKPDHAQLATSATRPALLCTTELLRNRAQQGWGPGHSVAGTLVRSCCRLVHEAITTAGME